MRLHSWLTTVLENDFGFSERRQAHCRVQSSNVVSGQSSRRGSWRRVVSLVCTLCCWTGGGVSSYDPFGQKQTAERCLPPPPSLKLVSTTLLTFTPKYRPLQKVQVKEGKRETAAAGNKTPPTGRSEVLQADESIKGSLLWTVQFVVACPVVTLMS